MKEKISNERCHPLIGLNSNGRSDCCKEEDDANPQSTFLPFPYGSKHKVVFFLYFYFPCWELHYKSQSYRTLISLFFRFLLLSLSVCITGNYYLYIKMAKRNSKKRKKTSFYKEKSLVGLTPRHPFLQFIFSGPLIKSFVLASRTFWQYHWHAGNFKPCFM